MLTARENVEDGHGPHETFQRPSQFREQVLQRIGIDEIVPSQVYVQIQNIKLPLLGTKDTMKITYVEMNFVEIMACIDFVFTW